MTGSDSRRWLFGAWPDLLLGCGLLYAAVFVGFALAGPSLRAAQPDLVVPALLVLLSMPHYGATIVRVYEQRESRRRYAAFSLWATAAVIAVFALGLHDVRVGSLLLTLYLTWSPWHYTGQNYGLSVMFLRRRGVALDPGTKRWLYASFGLSYALVFLALHADRGGGVLSYAADSYDPNGPVQFLPLALPAGIAGPLFWLCAAGYGVAMAVAGARLWRRGSLRDLVPSLALWLTQALWFSIPVAFRYARLESGFEPIDAYYSIQNYVFFIALGHAIQYLWVTSYYARASRDFEGMPRYLGKTLVAGVSLWTLPILLFSPDLLGPTSHASRVAVLMASAINLHHFILDGAIWKLRDGPIARVLLRSLDDRVGSAGPRWPRRLGWSLAIGWVLAQGLASLEYRWGALPALDPLDPPRVERSVERLRWLGRDDADLRFRLGVAAGARGDLEAARAHFRRSLEIEESGRSWVGLSHVEFHAGRPDEARRALERAVRTAPEDPETWVRASEVWRALGDPAPARAALERALALDPDRQDARARLEQLAPSDAATRG